MSFLDISHGKMDKSKKGTKDSTIYQVCVIGRGVLEPNVHFQCCM